MWKWIKRTLIGLSSILLVAVSVVWIWSGVIIGRQYEVPEQRRVLLSSRPEILAEGERLAQVFGCFNACHGDDMEGSVMFESPLVGRIVAPSLTQAIGNYRSAEFEAIVRQGVKPDGRSVIAMPSASFSAMTDRDYAAVVSFIRGYPDRTQELGHSRYGLLARMLMVLGDMEPEAAKPLQEPWTGGAVRSDPTRLGDYLALTLCAECHGADLRGAGDFAPDLIVTLAYGREEFGILLANGTGLEGRGLGLMRELAERRFSQMTAGEVDALFTHLQARLGATQP